jgi:DNA polymerase III delta prime subunit
MQNTITLQDAPTRRYIPMTVSGINKTAVSPKHQEPPGVPLPDLPIHRKIYEKLDYFHKSNKIPHIIFHGTSGSGKRTIVDNFIMNIYASDRQRIKSNVMFVNCAHGKGIKFIREELKFFAKTNIQSNNGVIFKTIVLLNADFLTIDAQSALRRCIELFSYNTRFFIIVENKEKLLNPILSRFCEIYVPEYMENGKIINLHQFSIKRNFQINDSVYKDWVSNEMRGLVSKSEILYTDLVSLADKFYEKGASCLDLMNWLENADLDETFDQEHRLSPIIRSNACMCFDKIKSEFRCEKLLLLYMFDFLFFRSNKDVKSISVI